MPLPDPMLAKSGPLPEGPDWRFELKLDGFRAIVSTTGGLRVRSRRGWEMSALVPELADLPPRLTLDGERWTPPGVRGMGQRDGVYPTRSTSPERMSHSDQAM